MTPATANTLRDFLERLAQAERSGDRRAAVEADLELHRQIMVASGHRRLYQIWTQLAEEMRLVIALSQRALPQVGWADRNSDVLAALESGDPDAAEAAIVRYFDDAHREMREVPDETLRSLMGERGDSTRRSSI
jgi:DNA-binding GntR family transcriptional regulator